MKNLALLTGAALAMAAFPSAATEEPQLVLGVMGDVHVRGAADGKEVPTWFSADKVRKILAGFRARHVDGVICTGDIADQGWERDFKAVADAWYETFPDDRLPDGSKVERLFVLGDHDVLRMMSPTPENLSLRSNLWERVWHEPYQRFVRKEVRGFVFLGAHFENDGYKGKELEQWLRAEVAKTDPNRPFFFAQHRHLAGTCYGIFGGDRCGGGRLTASILSSHPNAIAFSGHSHYSLTEEAGFWRGAFTSVGTGAAAYNVDMRRGRENGDAESKEVKSMPPLYTGREAQYPLMIQGSILTVYSNRVEIERFDFGFGEALGPKWIIPRPFAAVDPKADLAARKQAAARDRLAFCPGGVRVARQRGKNRAGVEEEQVAVSFPPAVAPHGNRAWDYEITLSTQHCDWQRIRAVKRLQAPDFYLPSGHAPKTVFCLFSLAELGVSVRTPARVEVRVFDAYGNNHAGLAATAIIEP